MPFTPFHFGPGIFVKSLCKDHFSLTAFMASQVIIDCETLYYLFRNEYPYHRTLHTFVGGTLAGLVVAAAMLIMAVIAFRISRDLKDWLKGHKFFWADVSPSGLLVGGLVGGFSHPVFDGLTHTDLRPLMPWSEYNPLLGFVDVQTVQLCCVLLGVIGMLLLLIKWYRTVSGER